VLVSSSSTVSDDVVSTVTDNVGWVLIIVGRIRAYTSADQLTILVVRVS
jgi:hypothetical protein